MKKALDRIDLKILDCLQKDASLSTSEIADRVGLSTTPCWRRIQNLEKAGIVRGRVALLDREQLNGSDPEALQVRDFLNQPGVGAAPGGVNS